MFYFSKFENRLKLLKQFLGIRVIKWFFIGSVSAFALGYIELLVTFALQLLLQKLNVLTDIIELPVFLQEWNPSTPIIIVFFILIIFLKATSQSMITIGGTIAYIGIGARLRINTFYQLLQHRNPKFISAAEVNFRITEIAKKAGTFCNFFVLLFNTGIQSLTLLIIMFWLTWKITLFSLGLLSFVGLILIKINRSIQPFAAQLPLEVKALNKDIQRVAQNWLLVYILRTNNHEYENMINKELRYHALNLRIESLSFVNNLLPSTLGMLLVLGIIYANIEYFQIEPFIFLSFIYIFLRFVQSIGSISQMTGRVIAHFPQYKIAVSDFMKLPTTDIEACVSPTKLISIFNVTPSYKNEQIDSIQKLKTLSSPPKIEFRNVSFSYEHHQEEVLKNIHFKIGSGQQIGITGKSGSGKSTMLGLILGLLHPTHGKVVINNQSSLDFFLKHNIKIGYVGPEPFLIEGTIKENIRYGHFDEGEISDNQYDQAIKLANLQDFIESHPDGFEYHIPENGEGLSAGQKQRLALARALLFFPNLLILDEASANLDSQTETEIANSIQTLKGKCTTVIVSHKPGILEYADSVINLEALKS